MNANAFQQMKPSAYLINTARGGLVDEQALVTALQNKEITGAGLDMINGYNKDNPLLELDNVVLTPHIGWLTDVSLDNTARIIVDNIEGFARGERLNVVN